MGDGQERSPGELDGGCGIVTITTEAGAGLPGRNSYAVRKTFASSSRPNLLSLIKMSPIVSPTAIRILVIVLANLNFLFLAQFGFWKIGLHREYFGIASNFFLVHSGLSG